MTQRLVTVFGGSGFLGRRIVVRLIEAGVSARVAVRRPAAAEAAVPGGAGASVTAVAADVRDEASVAAAVAGAAAVVNAVALYVERGAETFTAVHVEGARRLARLSAAAGVGRLVHVSGIGVDDRSPSAYVRARAEGESAVRTAFPGATVLRPSVLFGPGDAFFTTLAAMARRAPALALFGRGETRVQPVFVDDVAAAAAHALDNADTAGTVFELGGPDVFTYRALLESVCRWTGRRRVLLPVPFVAWELAAQILSVLPEPPLTRDQIALVRRDNVVAAGMPGLTDLGVKPTPVAAVVPGYLAGGSRA